MSGDRIEELGAALFRGAATIAQLPRRFGLAAENRLPKPVISVGNLAFGGTGKTPFTEMLARWLSEAGYVTCILSRGHAGVRDRDPLVVSNLYRVLVGPAQAGDEPFLLARRLPGVPVVVGHDRHAAGRLALATFPVHLFVMDDGFQHRQLHRDADLVLIDAAEPWSRLREGRQALRRAHGVVLTRTQRTDPAALEKLHAVVKDVHRDCAVMTARTSPVRLRPAWRVGASRNLPALDRLRVLAFAGIARPDAFFEDLRRSGARVERTVSFPDHHAYSKADVRKLFAAAEESGASALVTTEKDGVRLPRVASGPDLPVLTVGLRLKLDQPRVLDELLGRLLKPK